MCARAVNGQVFAELMSTGAVVAGRGTFEPAGGWRGDHHERVPIFILYRQKPGIDISHWPLVTPVHDITTAMAQAEGAAGDKNVLVHGAGIARLALPAGVLDELELHVIPVLLGRGRRRLRALLRSRSSCTAPGSSRERPASPTCTIGSSTELRGFLITVLMTKEVSGRIGAGTGLFATSRARTPVLCSMRGRPPLGRQMRNKPMWGSSCGAAT